MVYHGKNCDQVINLCTCHPCKNDATCSSEVGGYHCHCKTGFSGKDCEINNDECASSPCRNSGECRDGLDNFKCECSPGFKGKYLKSMVECVSC